MEIILDKQRGSEYDRYQRGIKMKKEEFNNLTTTTLLSVAKGTAEGVDIIDLEEVVEWKSEERDKGGYITGHSQETETVDVKVSTGETEWEVKETRPPNEKKAKEFCNEIAKRLIGAKEDSNDAKKINSFLNDPDNISVKHGVDAVLKAKYEKLNSDIIKYHHGLELEVRKELRDIPLTFAGDFNKGNLTLVQKDLEARRIYPVKPLNEERIADLEKTIIKLNVVFTLKKALSNPQIDIDYLQRIKEYSSTLKANKGVLAEHRDTPTDKFFKSVDSVLGTHLHNFYRDYFKPPTTGARLAASHEKQIEVEYDSPKPSR